MPKLKKEPFVLKIDPNRVSCKSCKGTGTVNKKKCPDCGGSGSSNKVNLLGSEKIMEKGVPQSKYEITITDLNQKKIIYKNQGFGGVLSIMEEVDKFSVSELEGKYQTAMWGNPLVQRFGIDRLEENFAKEIDSYIDILEINGLFASNREKIKKMLIQGNYLKLRKIMGMTEENSPENSNIEIKPTQKDVKGTTITPITPSKGANENFIERATEVLDKNEAFSIIMMERKLGANTLRTELMAKGISLKEIALSTIEAIVGTYAHKKGESNLNGFKKYERMLDLLKMLAETIAETMERNKDDILNSNSK